MLKKSIKKTVSCVLAVAMVLSLATISDVNAAKRATLKTKKIELKKGTSKKIVIKNKNKKRSYTFKSNRTKIAKVNKKGKITAVKQGLAKITVKEVWKVGKKTKNRKVGTVKVTVLPKDNGSTETNQPAIVLTPTPTPTPSTQVPTISPTETPVEPTIIPVINLSYDTFTYDFEEETA